MTNGNDSVDLAIIGNDYEQHGLAKREYFAAMAVSGMSVNFPELGRSHAAIIASQAVEIADALIAALNAPTEVSK